jgi:hypothetical protein
MPTEYYDYVLTIDGPGPEAVASALQAALAMPLTELHALGRLGKNFVLEHKNNLRQARRILEFAESC